jgi:hypothetical protein
MTLNSSDNNRRKSMILISIEIDTGGGGGRGKTSRLFALVPFTLLCDDLYRNYEIILVCLSSSKMKNSQQMDEWMDALLGGKRSNKNKK